MNLLSEPAPPRGVALPVAPGVRRIVADNPGPMTCHGTNTYLVDEADGVVAIDPGPDDAAHVAAILACAERPVVRILATHGHRDHVGALPALQRATGAAVGDATGFARIATPGHAADHVAFAWRDGVVFSGDHVMGWSTTVVSPPDGDMAAYLDSLNRLLAREGDRLYLPGHGPAVPQPHGFVRALRDHRLARERAALQALAAHGPATAEALVAPVYGDIAAALRPMAARSLLAHLEKLHREGRAAREDALFRAL